MDISDVRDKYPAWVLPHPNILSQLVDWVLWEDGHDEVGNFIGWCPLHDPAREVEASAEFNFSRGIMRCVGDCLKGRRAISIQNLLGRMNGVSND